MTSFVWIVVLASLVATHAQELDLFDALGDDDTPTEKPKVPVVPEPEAPKNPDPEPDKPAVVPPKEEGTGGDTGGFDLNDAFGEADNTPADPKKPDPGTGGGDPEPEKPAVVPPKDGGTGGGDFGLDDLSDVAGGNDYKPEGGKGGGRAADSGYNDNPSDHPHDQPADDPDVPVAEGEGEGVAVAVPWGRVLAQLLGDDLPEGLHTWIANLQATLKPLLQGALDLIDVAMGTPQDNQEGGQGA